MHQAIEGHPRYRAARGELDALNERRDKLGRRIAVLAGRLAQERLKWSSVVRAGVDDPDRADDADDGGRAERLQAEIDVLRGEQATLMAANRDALIKVDDVGPEIAADIRPALVAEEREVIAQVQALMPQLRALADRAGGIVQAAKYLGMFGRHSGRDLAPRLDVSTLVAEVALGSTSFLPEPVPPPPPPPPVVASAVAEVRSGPARAYDTRLSGRR